ncbi:murein biosynthesis integral membrane protein MurJ [Candidatus Nanoperiomorbus periodonticus]|uniref:murein biosynthesis integral membrane protein MurJ n=1 Tax=Candidatus Nanoperiomorbus periodonticus TaxID=2171989 RepID=UPI00101C5CBA|nr:murein biosynthesis integral membrane protein MurJ [Candidatus Nanoperiomorbus periodonticus]RYC75704.1 putative lipid II flippase MurJ [Candidatus Nanoperiomorbus periodonticus]
MLFLSGDKLVADRNKIQRQRRRNRALVAIARANQKMSVRLAAVILSSSTLVSALLGIYRDRLLNSMYLDTYKVGIDAYTVAFTIPDFMYLLLVSGALAVTFIPVFNSRLAKNNRESAWQMSTSLINFLALVTMATSVLIMIFAPILVRYVVGPGLSESGQELAISMMRVIAINPFLFAVATVISSVQQAVGRFVFNALAPTMYNLGIIIGAIWFTGGINLFGHQIFSGGIMGVALGVVLGAVLQLIVSSLGLLGLGFDYRFKIYWRNRGFRKILTLLPARSADQGLDYVSSIIDTNLASRMADGTIRAYQQASTLYNMPINLVGVAIATAAFPQLTERIGEGRRDLFAKELRSAMRMIIWFSLPIAMLMFFCRGYIVSIIDRGGNGTIAMLLGIFCLAIFLRSVFHIMSRSFYAFQDTKTPLLVSLVTLAVSVGLEIWLVFGWHMGAGGIAWAQVIWALLELTSLTVLILRRVPNLFDSQFWHKISQMLIACGVMSVVTYFMVQRINLKFENQNMIMVLIPLAVIGTVSILVYLGVSRLLRIEEAEPIIAKLGRIVSGRFMLGKDK